MGSSIRPNLHNMLAAYPPLEDPCKLKTESASLTSAYTQIKELQEENLALKKEIAEISSAYTQLISESSHECFDERRVNFLKAQLIQIERQLVILSEALGSRSSTLYEVENSLASLADLGRTYLHKDGRLGEISVLKSDLQKMVETAESSQLRLHKTMENTRTEKLERPVAMFDKFLRPSTINPPTIFDICSGNLDHLNLKHVARLESRLSVLYKQLLLIDRSLQSVIKSQQHTDNSTITNSSPEAVKYDQKRTGAANQDLPRCVYLRLSSQVMKTCNMLKDVTNDLLMLGVLVPSAPWPVLKKSVMKELTVETVMSKVTGLSRAKTGSVSQIVDSLIKAMNYSCHMANTESRALKEELAFHQGIYQLQAEYMENLFTALRTGYSEFEANTSKLLCEPLRDILHVYDTLRITAAEDSLKNFLQIFRDHADQLSDAVTKLSDHLGSKTGEEAISSYGASFFKSLDSLKLKWQKERDKCLDDIDVAKHQQQAYTEELHKMFQEPENQPQSTEINDSSTSENHVSICAENQQSAVRIKQNSTIPRENNMKKIQQKDISFSNKFKAPVVSESEDMNLEPRSSKKKITKPMKGIPQSSLALHPKKHRSLSPVPILPGKFIIDQDNNDHQILSEFSSETISSRSDVEPQMRPSRMSRSGSLSRLGERNIGHLEPLVGTPNQSRYSSCQNITKPWK